VASDGRSPTRLQVIIELSEFEVAILFMLLLFYQSFVLQGFFLVLLFVEERKASVGVGSEPAMGEG
jgi:hypothetical protein